MTFEQQARETTQDWVLALVIGATSFLVLAAIFPWIMLAFSFLGMLIQAVELKYYPTALHARRLFFWIGAFLGAGTGAAFYIYNYLPPLV